MTIGFRFSAVVAAILAFMTVGGCATAVKETVITYTYEPRASFPELKTYRWAKATPRYRQDSLLEANVQFLVDRGLEGKGLTSQTGKPDLLVWISYTLDTSSYGYGYGYELRMLTLNIARADGNELIWRGLATGNIRTDAASVDLKNAVGEMLVNFPPK